MTLKCKLCDFTTEKDSELMEHMMKKHAASSDQLFGAGT